MRTLLREQLPQWASQTLRFVGSGWDNVTWRLGDDLAVRVPRRQVAAQLILNEQRWVGGFAALLAPLRVAEVVGRGVASELFASPWSVVRWVDGEAALRRGAELADDLGLARQLGAVVGVLATSAAPPAAPMNPVRGVALSQRVPAFVARESVLRAAGEDWDALDAVMDRGLRAAEFSGAPVWVHGDLHPGNVIVGPDNSLAGLIDFGDLCQGDPACDVALAWWLFDEAAREVFIAAAGVDTATVDRARGWVAVIASAVIEASAAQLAAAARVALARAASDL